VFEEKVLPFESCERCRLPERWLPLDREISEVFVEVVDEDLEKLCERCDEEVEWPLSGEIKDEGNNPMLVGKQNTTNVLSPCWTQPA